ncbi:hypothetical protein FDI40_gp669 [Agrobacterium phage Atu_ph07]|uniref:Uncharacterized protein n=1 Tax=Agrobacterium phage Atu_ph07 TaxID=2024264 RepID=A0A2L0V0X7_9CAUD|nr:hypothetical protein FDI40_gp669 [Agrobacterium phage Atu_ph07]AUZ95425.1 hypothetical protein [Agrobacterium phage Atu_ph07]
MDITLLLIFLVPLTVAIFAVTMLSHSVSITEGVLLFVGTAFIVSGVWYAGRYSSADDYELWNGEIVRKQAITRGCPIGWQSYQDDFCTEHRTRTVKSGEMCSTDDKGNTTCTPIYTTEYNYVFDWERRYFVWTNVKYDFEIKRVDRQGVNEPPKYTEKKVGDPASSMQPYSNWVRAASENLYHEDGVVEEQYSNVIPSYPIKIYDKIKVDRVVPIGNVTYPETLNNDISVVLKKLGPERQMNFVLVLVDANQYGDNIAYAIRKKWYGFKKNDAVAIIGLDNNNIKWANVFSWSKKSLFDIELRDSIIGGMGKPIEYSTLIKNVETIGMNSFERRSMKEFEYLKNAIPVPTWLIVSGFILSVILSISLLIFFCKVDIRIIK